MLQELLLYDYLCTDSKKAALKWEYDYKRSEEERETMELSIEKLRNDMAKSDAKKKQLLEQVRVSWQNFSNATTMFLLCRCC